MFPASSFFFTFALINQELTIWFIFMLSRRHLRTKVLQSLYAFVQSGNQDITAGEKHLLKSIEKLHELYILQLSLLVEIVDYSRNRMEESKKKYFPTQEDLNPNNRFVNNEFIGQIEQNHDYVKFRQKYKINWSDERSMIRRLFNELKAASFFQSYMNSKDNSYEEDKNILIRIIKNIVSPHEFLEQYYEDKSVFWSFEDYNTANMMVIKTIKHFKKAYTAHHILPPVYKETPTGDMEDREFMLVLFRKSVLQYANNRDIIAQKARNWELDRIAIMDILLINMALVELTEFPSIPVKVSMNEYIEISKYFSSAKSKVFINGILDKLVAEFKAEKKIHKMGRGLLDN